MVRSNFVFFLLSYSYCNKTHETVSGAINKTVQKYLPELFQPTLLCAGFEISEQGTCKGDSGGPLMIFRTGKYKNFLK
jgi:hypothetical protein